MSRRASLLGVASGVAMLAAGLALVSPALALVALGASVTAAAILGYRR